VQRLATRPRRGASDFWTGGAIVVALASLALQLACGEDMLQNIPVQLDDPSRTVQALDYSCAVSSATGY
jgi:hypothetical protein